MDFYANWCGPCKIMEPILAEMEKEMSGQIRITKIDVDQEQDAISKYGVMSIPTYIIVKDDKEVDRSIGAISKEALAQKIKSYLS